MTRFTCRECSDSAFALRFARFEAPPGDAFIQLRECLDSFFVLCFTRFAALLGDAIHLQEVSRFSICTAFYTV